MKEQNYESQLGAASASSRFWMVAFFVTLIITLLLSVTLLSRKETVQTVLITPGMSQPFTLTDGRFSNSYVEQASTWFLAMTLNYTPKTYEYQMNTFLKYVDPSYFSRLRTALIKERDDILQQRRSSTFFPQTVDIRGGEALITGVRKVTVGNIEATHEQQFWWIKLNQRQDGLVSVADLREITDADAKVFRERVI